MKVIILRGIPGSGKSTYIKNNFPDGVICSADHYFEQDEEYKFDPRMIGEAHRSCQIKFLFELEKVEHKMIAVIEMMPDIIVDQTSTHLWEMAYYVGLANVFGVPLEIHRIECPIDVCVKRNIHNVPEGTIRSMAARMEKVPPFFAKEIVIPWNGDGT